MYSPIVRILRWLPVVTFVFSGCTCSSSPPPAPTPTAVVSTPTAAPTAVPSATIAPTEPAATPTVASARRADCERYVQALLRRGHPDSLDDPEVRALAIQSPDLVMCSAAGAASSDDLCRKLMPTEAGPSVACRRLVATFREMRDYPNGRSFLFNEVDWQDCQALASVAPTFCDTFRAAMRSGDAKDCAKTGDGESMCRAYINLDKSLCRIEGQLAKAQIALSDRKEGEPAKINVKDALEEGCRQAIDSRAFLAKGLKEVAESGPERERSFAKAVLEQADACEELAKKAVDACAASGQAAEAAPNPTPGQ